MKAIFEGFSSTKIANIHYTTSGNLLSFTKILNQKGELKP